MTQDSDVRPRSVIREEATLALDSCRPFPAFEKVASVLSPDQVKVPLVIRNSFCFSVRLLLL